MNADDPKSKWHRLGDEALAAMRSGASGNAVVYPIGTNCLPLQVQRMPGVVSYFVSSYERPVHLNNCMTAGAELAVVRTDAGTAKAYNYVVATSTDGAVYFNGPHKDFPAHHTASTASVDPTVLFGHVPLSTKPKV